jgi:TolB protein
MRFFTPLRLAAVVAGALVLVGGTVSLFAAGTPGTPFAADAPGTPGPLPGAHDPDTRPATGAPATPVAGDSLRDPREVHLRNVRQLTFSGENAEAYFSPDGSSLIFQARGQGEGCDQIHTLDLATGETRLVSTGQGRTTCGYYYPTGDRILYSSTHHWDPSCPPAPDMSQGYVWALYPTYDIFAADPDGSDLVQLTESWGYDAEATFSPVEDLIVFTSMRDGDLEIYTMRGDGSDVRRLTHRPGYDGGPFFSPDGTKIVYRAHYPDTPEELAEYRRLLAQGLIRPSRVEVYVMEADGSNQRQVTEQWESQLRPLLPPLRREDHLQHQLPRSGFPGAGVRSLHGEPGRHGPEADHLRPGVRRLPHVQPRREVPRLRLQPERESPRQHQRVHRRVGGGPGGLREIGIVLPQWTGSRPRLGTGNCRATGSSVGKLE